MGSPTESVDRSLALLATVYATQAGGYDLFVHMKRDSIPAVARADSLAEALRTSVRPKASIPARGSRPSASYDELAERLAYVPEHATTRGMFFLDLLQHVPTVERPRSRYIPFKSYPLREFMELAIKGVRTSYSSLSLDDGLRRIGHSAYKTFAESLAGTSLFGITDHEYLRILELAPKGYKLSVSPGDVELEMKTEGSAIARLRNIWSFPESYHLGLWEGGMRALHVRGQIEVEVVSHCAVDLHLSWDPGSTSTQRSR